MEQTATFDMGAQAHSGTSKLAFARHYGEMVLVMFAGMAVFGGLTALGLVIAGSSPANVSGGLLITLMGLWMTAPMVAWMAYRGHTTAQNGEMAASMVVPTALVAALAWSGAVGSTAGLEIQHLIMLPAMLGVMLWRYDEYAHVHGA